MSWGFIILTLRIVSSFLLFFLLFIPFFSLPFYPQIAVTHHNVFIDVNVKWWNVCYSTSRGCMTSSQHPVDYYNGSRRPTATGVHHQPAPTVWTCHEGVKTASAATSSCRAHTILEAILDELRSLTEKIRAEDERSELTGEWKHAAMVIDRFCLWTFTGFTIILTLAILFSAPHLLVL